MNEENQTILNCRCKACKKVFILTILGKNEKGQNIVAYEYITNRTLAPPLNYINCPNCDRGNMVINNQKEKTTNGIIKRETKNER